MSRFTLAGILLWLGSFSFYGYQAILSVMSRQNYASGGAGADTVDVKMNLLNTIGQQYFDWIDGIPWFYVHKAVTYVVEMQIYSLLFCLGALCLLIGVFFSE